MKIINIIAALVLIGFSSQLYSSEISGLYATKPEIVPGFIKPYSAVVKKAIERLSWEMKITDKDIYIWTQDKSEPLVIPYTRSGNYLLGEGLELDTKMYIPFYIENKGMIHGFGTVFYKTNE